MSIYHLDYETTSACDIGLGAYRYAADPSTRILMFALAEDDLEPFVWRFDQPNSAESHGARKLLKQAIDSGSLIYAHNAQFELAISTYRLDPDLSLKSPALAFWRCTQAMCYRAAINPSLADAAKTLRLNFQKDRVGKALIDIFSDQNKQVTLYPPKGSVLKDSYKIGHPLGEEQVKWEWQVTVGGERITLREAWEKFIAYCRQDVRVEQQLHQKLARFELEGDVLDSFQFDLEMNFRGVPVNREALQHALGLVQEYQKDLAEEFTTLCGLTPTQTEKVKQWLIERGYSEKNLQSDTIQTILDKGCPGMTAEAKKVLKLRSLLSFSAIQKIPSMLASCCPDGRVRGTTQWHGARTGRATGRIIQPQNMKKATITASALAYRMICEKAPIEDFLELWDSPLEVIASCIRHFIQPPEGNILDVDFVGVEARIAPWLAGEDEKLQSILSGLCQYKVMASEIVFNIPYSEVTKEQRTVGKPVELSCVYGTGGAGLMRALRDTHKVIKSLSECDRIVKKYRGKFPKLTQTWRDMEDAAGLAIREGRTTYVAGGKIGFGSCVAAGIRYLVMKLPSGRKMYYPNPKADPITMVEVIKKGKEGSKWGRVAGHLGEEQIPLAIKAAEGVRFGKFFHTYALSFYGKGENNGPWGRVHTWGSRLFENACQAIGADLLNYGCLEAKKAGYDIFMIIHDQALAYADKSIEGFKRAICHKQSWAASFPLEASGSVEPFYLKD